MAFVSVSRSHVGLRRQLNEDAVLCAPQLALWAVADGMGGHDAGEVASALVVEALQARGGGGDVALRVDRARQALMAANEALLAMSAQGPVPRTIGTTVVVLAADAGAYACLWAGDSRAYRLRGAALVQLTRDHSLVQELVDAGELDPRDADAHPNANIVRRAVGAVAELELDVVEGDLAPGDTFLLASDGLTRVVDDETIAAALRSPDPDLAADALIEATLARGAPDNVSLVLIRVAGET